MRLTKRLELEGMAPSIGTIKMPTRRPDRIDDRTVPDQDDRHDRFHNGPYKPLADVEYVAAG